MVQKTKLFMTLCLSIGANNEESKTLTAIATKESSLNSQAIGDKGKAYGYFQFHEDRWNEYEKKIKRKRATKKEQVTVMLRVLRKKNKKSLTLEENVVRLCRYHNIGNNKKTGHFPYSRDVWKIRETLEKKK